MIRLTCIYIFFLLVACASPSKTIELFQNDQSYWGCYERGSYTEYEFDHSTLNVINGGSNFPLSFNKNSYTVNHLGETYRILYEVDTFHIVAYVNSNRIIDTGTCIRLFPSDMFFFDDNKFETRKSINISRMDSLRKEAGF